MSEKRKLLFVCLGNIVRSPLAEHMFATLVREAGLTAEYEVDSAGTAGYHVGDSPDARMRQVAAEFGLIYNGASRQFKREDFDRFDFIIVMDTSNKENVLRLAEDDADRNRVYLIREFDDQAAPEASVPDPYYGGIDGFYQTYEIVKRAATGLLAALQAGSI